MIREADRLAFQQRPERSTGMGLAPTGVLWTEGTASILPKTGGLAPWSRNSVEASGAWAEGARGVWQEMRPERELVTPTGLSG